MNKKILLIMFWAMLAFSCGDDDDNNSTTTSDSYDRSAMLTYLADHIIIPAFQDFLTHADSLTSKADQFIENPDQANLDLLRTAWLAAYQVWQSVEMFNIGKAEELTYGFYVNVYPTTTADIESNISTGTYDLTTTNNQDAQGLPALDYLLYGVGADDNAILAKYTSPTNGQNYKDYLKALVDRIESLTQQVVDDWTGSYRAEFIAGSDNTATSSVNKLVNDFVYYYEKGFRANKIGIPAGVFSSTTLPDRVEAYYKQDVSKTLANNALDAIQNFFKGKDYSADTYGESFQSYLTHLGATALIDSINTNIDEARAKINDLDANFSNQVSNDNNKMLQTYDAIQVVVPYLKVDMLQQFDVSVDYVDADGD